MSSKEIYDTIVYFLYLPNLVRHNGCWSGNWYDCLFFPLLKQFQLEQSHLWNRYRKELVILIVSMLLILTFALMTLSFTFSKMNQGYGVPKVDIFSHLDIPYVSTCLFLVSILLNEQNKHDFFFYYKALLTENKGFYILALLVFFLIAFFRVYKVDLFSQKKNLHIFIGCWSWVFVVNLIALSLSV